MAKRELIANDPMETRLMTFTGTVNKIALVVILIIAAGSLLLGMAFSAGDLLIFAAVILPGAVLILLVWLAKELICLWLENQTEMHCYARTQTEILMEQSEEK